MATDDDAAAKAAVPPAPAPEPAPAAERRADEVEDDRKDERKDADRKDASDRINERLTQRIRQGTHPPPLSEREPRDPREDKLNETIRQRLEHLVPELVKKTFAAGMGAVFSTEEGIRKLAREVSLPDVVGYAASSADAAKDKVFEIVARETREFLSNLNLTEEIAKILTTLSFEIKTEIRFIPNSERITGAEPDVKASVRLKRNDKAMGNAGNPASADPVDDTDQPRDSRSRLRFWRREDQTGEPREREAERERDDDDTGHDR